MKLLFIGNSHTFYNDMPAMVLQLLKNVGEKSHVTMVTEGGQTLMYHCDKQTARFNIRYGGYDAVVAQDRVSDFDPALFQTGAERLLQMTAAASVPLSFYMPWAPRDQRAQQAIMTDTYSTFCRRHQCALAPAGEVFSRLLLKEPADLLYREDGAHATMAGSYVAAATIFYMLTGRRRVVALKEDTDPGIVAGLSPDLCHRIHAEACRVVRLYNG